MKLFGYDMILFGYDMKLFGYDMILFGYDMILLGSRVQYISVLLVSVLINFGVKKQVPKISFKIFAKDLMPVFSHEFADIIFCKYLYILEITSDFRSDPFTLIDLELPTNSYMIACTDTQGFEGENCASTISGAHSWI